MAYGPVNVGQAQQEANNGLTTEQVGVPGGLATLGGDGKLTESQRPAVDAYTTAQTDTKISEAVSTHNESESAHAAIRAQIDAVKAEVKALDLKYGEGVTENAFTVGFSDLNSVDVTGVWNSAQARLEF